MGQKCWIISCVKYALGERFIANLKCAVCFHCCIQCPLLVGLFFNVFWGYRYICVCHMQDTFFFGRQSAKLNLKIALPIKMKLGKTQSDFKTVLYMQSNTFSNSLIATFCYINYLRILFKTAERCLYLLYDVSLIIISITSVEDAWDVKKILPPFLDLWFFLNSYQFADASKFRWLVWVLGHNFCRYKSQNTCKRFKYSKNTN